MFDPESVDWQKVQSLVPAIVQSSWDRQVLMLGYMTREALQKTLSTGLVTFWSRSRSTLWTKGETSGNHLELKEIYLDCDRDTLLIEALPRGPVCHRNTPTCFDGPAQSPDGEMETESVDTGVGFLETLEKIIHDRRRNPSPDSYTVSLFGAGREKILQKLGEEAIEVLVSALQSRERSIEETADLIYHLLVFLADREIALAEVVAELRQRHQK